MGIVFADEIPPKQGKERANLLAMLFDYATWRGTEHGAQLFLKEKTKL